MNDPASQHSKLKRIGGSDIDDFNTVLTNQVIRSLWSAHSDEETLSKQSQATIAAMLGIGPNDEIEGMLGAQLIACHNASLECYRRAMIPEQTFEGRRENLNQANKLSRTYAALVEALNRHRGKGQQKVTVEHVHVHQGGQAIVGHVATGGGAQNKAKEQPDTKSLTHAPVTPLWSENAQGEPVPITGGAREAEVPNARRRKG